MSSIITNALPFHIKSGDSTRFVQTNTNLDFNGILIDLDFTVPADYANKWDFLKTVYLQVMLRLGTENGGSIPLISDVPIYDLLEYSDYVAGVSMASTDFTLGNKVRISGYLPIGFYSMNSRDALEFTVNIGKFDKVPADTSVSGMISTVYEKVQPQSFMIYKSAKPTNADQPYKDVLKIFYTGTETVNKNCTIQDQLGSKSTNIEDAIALSNAIGNFEFFTRFGKLYEDEYGISQDLAFRCPNDDPDATILLVQYGFYPQALVDVQANTDANYNSLVEKVKTSSPDKYDYLVGLGVVR